MGDKCSFPSRSSFQLSGPGTIRIAVNRGSLAHRTCYIVGQTYPCVSGPQDIRPLQSGWRVLCNRVTTQPRLIRKPERGEQRCSFSPHDCHMGGRPQAASLVQGLRPRNAPLQNHPSPTLCAHSSRVAPAAYLATSVSSPTCRLNPPTMDR